MRKLLRAAEWTGRAALTTARKLDGSRGRRFVPLLLGLWGAVWFTPVIGGDFVRDDIPYIVENAEVVLDRPMSSAFSTTFPPHGPHGLYRPLTTLSFRSDQVFGGSTIPFHLTNIILHAIATILVFLLVRRVGAGFWAAAAGAALYGAHPTHAEAVAWISGRSELLSFVAGAFALLMVTREAPNRRWLIGAGFVVLGATLAKESGVVFAPLGAALMACCPGGLRSGRWRRAAPLFVGALAGIAWKWLATGSVTLPAEVHALGGLGIAERLGVALRLLGLEYPLMTVWPDAMRIDVPLLTSEGAWSGRTWLGFLGAVGLVGATALAWRRRHAALAMTTAWFCVALFPYLHLLTPIGETAAQRFLFTPSAALAFAVASLAPWLRRRVTPRRLGIATVVLLLFVGVFTALRAAEWRTEAGLWRAASDRHPSSPEASLGVALAEEALEDRGQVMAALDRVLKTHPRHPETLYRRAHLALAREKDIRGALEFLGRLEEVHPDFIGLATLRGLIRQTARLREPALEDFRIARAASRHDPVCRAELARDAIRRKAWDEAEVLLRELIPAALPRANHGHLTPALIALRQLVERGALSLEELQAICDRVLPWIGPREEVVRPDGTTQSMREWIEELGQS